MSQVLSVDLGNYVNFGRVVAITTADSAPVKRTLQQAIKDSNLIDSTPGCRTKSLVYMDTGHILISCLTTETLAKRIQSSYLGNNQDNA